MDTPNIALMRAYGNEDVFFNKTAGFADFLRRKLQLRAAADELDRREAARTRPVHLEAQRGEEMQRLMELARLEHAVHRAKHTRVPIILSGSPRAAAAEDIGLGAFQLEDYTPAAAAIPAGFTEGMVRMAAASGEMLAKQAAEEAASGGFLHRLGLEGKTLGVRKAVWKPLALAGAAGGLYLGTKAMNRGLRSLGTEPATPTYNAGGNQLAPDVNEYGQAQLRLPSTYY